MQEVDEYHLCQSSAATNIFLQDNDSINGYDEFYSFGEEFQKRVPVISFAEFIKREGGPEGILKLNDKETTRLTELAAYCENRKKSEGDMYYVTIL